MKTKMVYESRSYGNKENAPKYSVTVTRKASSGKVDILFDFAEPAKGRGVSPYWTQNAKVESISVSIPVEICEALGRALELALDDFVKGKISFGVDETAENPVHK